MEKTRQILLFQGELWSRDKKCENKADIGVLRGVLEKRKKMGKTRQILVFQEGSGIWATNGKKSDFSVPSVVMEYRQKMGKTRQILVLQGE